MLWDRIWEEQSEAAKGLGRSAVGKPVNVPSAPGFPAQSRKNREEMLAAVVFRHYISGAEGVVEIESRKREQMGV